MLIDRYRIRKCLKITLPNTNRGNSIKNFKIDKTLIDQKDIEYLNNKNVYPFSFDFKNNLILFLETESRINNNDTSFFYEPLQKNAKYLLKVNFEDFCQIIEKYEITDGKNVVFIHHPGRCGSTLLHKLLGTNPQIESFSEDLIFDNLFIYTGKTWAEKRNICVKLLSFLVNKWGRGNKILAFKMTGWSIEFYKTLFEIFPKSKHIYLTRDIFKIVESFINLTSTHYFHKYARYTGFMYLRTYGYNKLQKEWYNFKSHIHMNVISPNIRKLRRLNLLEAYLLRVLIYDTYFGFHDNKNLINLDFQDLLNKDMIIRTLSDFLEIDQENLFNLSIYDKHSQAGSIADSSVVKKYKLSENRRAKLEKFKLYVEDLLAMPEDAAYCKKYI